VPTSNNVSARTLPSTQRHNQPPGTMAFIHQMHLCYSCPNDHSLSLSLCLPCATTASSLKQIHLNPTSDQLRRPNHPRLQSPPVRIRRPVLVLVTVIVSEIANGILVVPEEIVMMIVIVVVVEIVIAIEEETVIEIVTA